MASAPQPRFRVLVRRADPPEGPYCLRFEVREGKGAFRLSRPGMVIDPPARPQAEERGLTLAQLRATRFVHVWEGGRARAGHALTRVDAGALAALPRGEWVELEPVTDQGASYLVLPASDISLDDEEGSLVDAPTSPIQMLGELREQVDAAAGRRPRAGASPRASLPVEEPTELPMHSAGWTESPLNLAQLPVEGGAPPAEEAWPGLALHERNTTLVRHLRRQVRELEARNRELEARLRGGRSA